MNPILQHKFEMELIKNKITEDRRIFDKHKDGVYKSHEVFFMYRVWVMKEVQIEKMERDIEESFMCGYTEAEYDFKFKRKLND